MPKKSTVRTVTNGAGEQFVLLVPKETDELVPCTGEAHSNPYV